jgi:hypothetical protein
LETAIVRRWNVDLETAAATVNSALQSTDERVRMRAAQIAVLMEAQNQKDEHSQALAALTHIRDQLAALRDKRTDEQPGDSPKLPSGDPAD